MNDCEIYECLFCRKELNVTNIKKCNAVLRDPKKEANPAILIGIITPGKCQSFRCTNWLCSKEMYIDGNGDIKKGHDPMCSKKH